MKIKTLEAKDHLLYKKIRLEMLKSEPTSFGSSYDDESKLPKEQWLNRLNNKNAYTLGMFDGKKIVGLCVLMLNPREKMKHGANIYSVYVTEKYRRLGIAKKLICTAIEIASSIDVEILYLSVVTHNKLALSLYSRLGFSIYGEEPKMIKYNGMYIDEYLMFKVIKGTKEDNLC